MSGRSSDVSAVFVFSEGLALQSISNFADLMPELLSGNRRSRYKIQLIKFRDSIVTNTYMRIAARASFYLNLKF